MSNAAPVRRSEAGTTLIELVVTIAIMGIAFVGVVGGIGTAIIGADTQKRRATAGIVLTSAAETIVAETTTPYVACAQPADYQDPALLDPLSHPDIPPYTVRVMEVLFWDGSTRFAPLTAPCPSPPADGGVQLITLELTPPSSARPSGVQTLQIVKRRVNP